MLANDPRYSARAVTNSDVQEEGFVLWIWDHMVEVELQDKLYFSHKRVGRSKQDAELMFSCKAAIAGTTASHSRCDSS